jgi:hypothetical protein
MLLVDTALEWHGEALVSSDIGNQLEKKPWINDHQFAFYPDSFGQTSPCSDSALLGLLGEVEHLSLPRHTRDERQLAGLTLAPAPEKGTFRRVGMWTLSAMIKKEGPFPESYSGTSLFSHINGMKVEEITLV